MNVIVGLGNPGQTYHDTRHNVGFLVVQLLAERHGIQLLNRMVSPEDGRPAGISGDYTDGGHAVRLVMPLTMMNDSGSALRVVDVEPTALLIVCDDVNLPLGSIRIRPEGGPGGHHGLESCLAGVGTDAVPRLRIGVGVDAMPKALRDFVLSPFQSAERALAKQMMAQAADACEMWVRKGVEATMNQYNRAQGA